MDRRSQRTRRAIYEAFSGLLARKKYSQITVQEILDAADIGRSTFYAHFSTKEDLLREICDELFGHIFYYAPPLREDAGGEEAEDPAKQRRTCHPPRRHAPRDDPEQTG